MSKWTLKKYKEIYSQSLRDPHFWTSIASELYWKQYPKDSLDEGVTNIIYNCLNHPPEKVAYIWRNEQGARREVSYGALKSRVEHFSSVLRAWGVKKGDIVTIYMPPSIETVVAMLSCARIGAVHSVVYGGFSSQALSKRIIDAKSTVCIVSAYTIRRGKRIELLSIARKAIDEKKVHLIIDTRGETIQWRDNESLYSDTKGNCKIEWVKSTHPLFRLYTSGTTGMPKAVTHVHGGYSVYAYYTTKSTFGLNSRDIYWCTADPGWITGHTYGVYGPLICGATCVLYEGAPDYPFEDSWWSIIEKEKVTVFYTSPTAIRLLMTYGNKKLKEHNLSSLRLLGTVGEPINPSVWKWYQREVGGGRTPVVDTWWQTETGGHMITTLPGLRQKPGWAGLPYIGVRLRITNKHLYIVAPWPGMWRELHLPYNTGDIAQKDKDGYIRILGRSDDVIQVSGHRIGTAELESVIVECPGVVEAAVVSIPEEVHGEQIIAFVRTSSAVSEGAVQDYVRREYGTFAVPSTVNIVDTLPKTRSGKIMRRMLRARALGTEAGDLSTLEE